MCCTILHSHQRRGREFLLLYVGITALVLSVLFIWLFHRYVVAVCCAFTYFYLMDNDIKYLVMRLWAIHTCPLVKCKIKFLHNFYRVVLCWVSRVLFTSTYAINHNTLLLFLFHLPFNHFYRPTFPCNKIIAINMIKLHRTMHTYYSNVTFLVLISYNSSIRWNQRRTVGEGHTRISLLPSQLPVNL